MKRLVFVLAAWGALVQPALAQPLGTFRWQLQPFCNVVTFNVVQQGAQYLIDGTDDQCGATVKASAVGLAFQNPNGSIGFGFTIVTSPGGAPVHVEASIAIANLSGTWKDSVGNSGTFVFTPGAAVAGSTRPTLPVTIQVGGATEVVRRGTTGTQSGTTGWQPDNGNTSLAGIWLEGASAESGGFFANGNTAAIWSPGDTPKTVLNSTTLVTGVLLSIYDEDDLSAGSTASPRFIFGNGTPRAIDTFTGAYLTTGGVWTNSSDRNRKRNIVTFDTKDALARLRQMPIYQWTYTAEGDGILHVGPMAQDFHKAFGLNGDDDTHIATVDADGVVMASVVAVADQADALRDENTRLRTQVSDLEARLARIEALLAVRPLK